MPKYTFRFDRDSEKAFQGVLSRLEEDTYTIIDPIKQVDTNDRLSDRECTIEMDEESCLTFRMRMGNSLKIKRERTAEEEAAKKEREERHIIRVNVKVDGLNPNGK